MHYDVFNGDADGIIALLQLRLADPIESTLITGVKRDIELLKHVNAEQASGVTVLDISMEKNHSALSVLLDNQIEVFYADHHRAGNIPASPYLQPMIDTDPNTCTSLIINKYLDERYVFWAIAAAYGDNMINSAEQLADKHELSLTQRAKLKELGIYINYNGYGQKLEDLHFKPDELYRLLLPFVNPFDLIEQTGSVFEKLKEAYTRDIESAKSSTVLHDCHIGMAILLPDESWARRVSGVYGNDLANLNPDKAHMVFTTNDDGTYTVSLRAPLNNKQGAGDICSSFATGGGRAAAAGINQLPEAEISTFIAAVTSYYSKSS